MTPPERLRSNFYSDDWLTAVRDEAQRLLDAQLDSLRVAFSFAEAYLNAPTTHSPPGGGRPGFTLWLAGGRATVRRGAAGPAEVDLVVESEWDDVVEGVRLPTGPAYDEFRRRRAERGRIKITGDPSAFPPFLHALHDAVVARTL